MTFTHLDKQGNASMVDISDKADTIRTAIAEGFVYMSDDMLEQVEKQTLKKGDVLSVARIAGIQAAKKCADLIPLCHPLALSKVAVTFAIQPTQGRIRIESLCRMTGKTGVEMEALCAVSTAALTIFDMCKSLGLDMRIDGIRVLDKQGGKSGHWQAE